MDVGCYYIAQGLVIAGFGYSFSRLNSRIQVNLIAGNPASAFAVDDAGGIENSRDRALTTEELKFTFKKFREEADSFTRDNYLACALLVLLGTRKGELTEAKWSEFDLDKQVWHLPSERSKSGVAIDIPLPDLSIEWLNELKIRAFDSAYVFPNRRAAHRVNRPLVCHGRGLSRFWVNLHLNQ